MTREGLDKVCAKGILGLVLAILVFGPLATGAVRTLEFLVIQGLTLAATVLWLLRFWLNPNHRLLWPPICWSVIAFAGYAIIRYQQADIEYVARQELIRILVYALLFFIVLNNLHSQEAAQWICFTLIFLGMAISMYAIYQFATKSEYVWLFVKPLGYRERGSGTYICPNHLAGFLEMVAPLGLAYSLIGRLSHVMRVFLAYASVAILAGVAVSVSRGGWIAAGVSLFLLFALLIKRRPHRAAALVVLVLLIAGGATFYTRTLRVQQRFDRILAVDSLHSSRIRVWLWKPAVQMWRDHFWVGVGPGHYDYRFPQYRPPELQRRPGYAHNDYLNTLADWGTVGTVLVAVSFGLLSWGVIGTWRFVRRDNSDLGAKPSNRAALVIGAATGLVAILVHSFTDFNMQVPANAILAIVLMALLSGFLRFATDRYWVRLSALSKIPMTILALVSLVYLGQQGWRRFKEHFFLDRAAREEFYTSERISALEQAFTIEPLNPATAYQLGEDLRNWSWQSSTEYKRLATDAVAWFRIAGQLNPYDPYIPMGIGMCLDWLGQHDQAAPYYEMALKLDPNDYYARAHQGWHFVQTGDLTSAKLWFERALTVFHGWHKPIAPNYLRILEQLPAKAPLSTPINP